VSYDRMIFHWANDNPIQLANFFSNLHYWFCCSYNILAPYLREHTCISMVVNWEPDTFEIWIFCSFNTDRNLKIRDQWRDMRFHDDESACADKTTENAREKKKNGKDMGSLCRNYSAWNASHISGSFAAAKATYVCSVYALRIDA